MTTMVGTSEREYYKNGNRSAYIVLNSTSGMFRVYLRMSESRPGSFRMVAEYKTLAGAKSWMKKRSFMAEGVN